MKTSDFPSSLEIHKMRERLNQIQQQIKRSQLAFANDITISNVSGKNLTLTVNIESKEPSPQKINVQSKINMPNNSTVTHRITSEQRFSIDTTNQQESANRRNALLSSAKRNKELQEKQSENNPQGKMSEVNEEMGKTIKRDEQITKSYQSPYRKKNKEIVIQDDPQSDIQEQSQSKFKSLDDSLSLGKTPQVNRFTQTKHYEPNTKQSKGEQKNSSLGSSPQVLNYLRQEYSSKQPQINTPFKINFFKPNLQATKQQIKNTPSRKPGRLQASELFYTPSQSMSREAMINQLFTQSSKQNNSSLNFQLYSKQRSTSKKKDLSSSYKLKENTYQSSKKIPRADALFMERKAKVSKNIQPNSKEKYFKKEQKPASRTTTIKQMPRSSSKTERPSLSPKLEQITKRLYEGRSRSPCWRNRVFNQSQERQRFNVLVKENPLVNRYMCEEQKQQLFQRLRHQEQSISLWPMKILNYTYSKLKKSHSLAYSLLQ